MTRSRNAGVRQLRSVQRKGLPGGGNTAQGPFLLLLAAVAGIFVWGVLMLIDMVRWLSGYSQRWLREN